MNGLKIHRSLKHKTNFQLDGFVECESESEINIWTDKYWTKGYIGENFQTYLDVVKEINLSNLTQDLKDEEIMNVKEARLKTWIERRVPPERCNF